MSTDEKVILPSMEEDPINRIFGLDMKNYVSKNHESDLNSKKDAKNASLFSFLHVELTRGYVLEHDQERYTARREKVYSFMKIPRELEKFMSYGFLQCVDSFLFVYTFLPIRVMLAIWTVLCRTFSKCFGIKTRNRGKPILTPAEICDLLKACLIISCSALMMYIDTNMMYHLIKSQSVIKLYIFFNILEVGDRLFSAFGQDTIDALYWTATEPRGRRREHFGVVPHLLFAIVYVFFHSILVLFQATTLNVAINSSNKALLTIMMSNNFVELKGGVFKKFDKNNLFQVSCSDVRERFHLIVLLFIVAIQTMKEYSWRSERFWVLLPDCLLVILAEVGVDWIKHAFITRFNELQVQEVYRDYTISLAYDVAQTRQKHAFSDHSDLVARRMGFIPIPLGVVMIRVLAQALHISNIGAIVVIIVAYLCTFSWKIFNGIIILGKACSLISLHKASLQSPLNNKANVTVTLNNSTSKVSFVKDVSKEYVNSNSSSNLSETTKVKFSETDLPPTNLNLDSSALFTNSTVDLKNVSLNDELLNVECTDIKMENLDKTQSNPNIKCDILDRTLVENENSLRKRAESDPNLA